MYFHWKMTGLTCDDVSTLVCLHKNKNKNKNKNKTKKKQREYATLTIDILLNGQLHCT
jgi:hypothetical protein